MKVLRFSCEDAGISFWFKHENILIDKNNLLKIDITQKELDKIISQLQQFKFIINYDRAREKEIFRGNKEQSND